MIFVEKLKYAASKSLVFLKTFGWIIAVLTVGIVGWIFTIKKARAADKLVENLTAAAENHRKQIAALQEIKNQEIMRREQIEADYRAEIERINREHAGLIQQINKEKEKEVKAIVAETQGNPEAMASRVNRVFGLPVVVSSENESSRTR